MKSLPVAVQFDALLHLHFPNRVQGGIPFDAVLTMKGSSFQQPCFDVPSSLLLLPSRYPSSPEALVQPDSSGRDRLKKEE